MSNQSRSIPLGDQSDPVLSDFTRSRRPYLLAKRLFDVTFSVCALLVVWPLIILGAVAVKLTSPGPAFYRAKRAGLRGHPFDMLKLRTMYVNTDALERRITEAKDDRITPVGSLLRKFRLDELPQFWNVARGEMSIVGPRPEDFDIVQQYYKPEHFRSLNVRPGISSPAIIRWYPDLTYHDPPPDGVSIQQWYLERHLEIQVAEAIRYAEQQSFLLDLQVVAQTAYCILVHSWSTPERKTLTTESS